MTIYPGLPLDEAIARLEAEGILAPKVIYTAGRREAPDGVYRVLRAYDGGREITVARFPVLRDCAVNDDEPR